ncbi:MAG: hypothetical protein LBS59_08830 [Puniceicoccales bacterium]|nr:hypothetical protein [Puniceicoccales bacterium]
METHQKNRSKSTTKHPRFAPAMLAAAALLATAATAAAAEPWATPAPAPAPAPAPQAVARPAPAANQSLSADRPTTWAIDGGLAIWAGGSAFVGPEFSLYRHFSEAHRLKVGLSVLLDVDPEEIPNSSFTYQPVGGGSRRTGHLVTRYTMVPLVVGYQYLTDFTPSLQGRIGVELGLACVIASVELEPHVNNYKNTQGSDSAVLVVGGVTAGLTYIISKSDDWTWYADLSVTGYVTSEGKFKVEKATSPGHSGYYEVEAKSSFSGAKIGITAGVRF